MRIIQIGKYIINKSNITYIDVFDDAPITSLKYQLVIHFTDQDALVFSTGDVHEFNNWKEKLIESY